MATSSKVKILEVCTVAQPTVQGSATLPLTFFDMFWLRFPPNQRLFFYEAPCPTTTFTSTIIPKLKCALSLTLKHYFPLSGNLTWPQDSDKPFIENIAGDAVSFTVAESQADFYILAGNSYHRAKEYNSLLPLLLATDTKVPVMALQVTMFPNMGFSIGYAIHHIVMDGKTTSMFMHAWASFCRHGDDLIVNPQHIPVHNRSFIKSQVEIEKAYLQGWTDQGGPNNKSVKPSERHAPADTMYGTFLLTKAGMEKIKKWVCSRWQEKHKEELGFHFSSYTIICAHIWVCFARSQRLASEKANLVISVDCRARLDPCVPSTYFGNCVLFRMAEANTKDLMGEDGVLHAAQAINKAIGSLRDGVLDGAEDWIHQLFMQTDGLYSVSGASGFGHYNTDFGWGRPKKVELVSLEKGGTFSISDCRDSDGEVEVGVALTRTELETFNSLFTGFGSSSNLYLSCCKFSDK